MKKYYILILILAAGNLVAQSERLQSMGGIQYVLPDYQYSLNPYDFGGNPAWLYMDETESWLKIIPGYAGFNGDYKRRYDPGSENLFALKFAGIKTLGEDGTFLGETSYEYRQRKDVPNSLKYNTYAGEAFFLTDTATGNFRYNGPSIKFSYSFEPLEKLYTGASVGYRILDGLKSVYSRAEVLYRDIEINAGAAYQLTDNLILGANYIYNDNQEKIQSASEDLLDVEVFNFKGETYSLMKRAQAVSQKLTGIGHKVGGQIFYKPSAVSEIALIVSTGRTSQKVLMSRSVTGQSFNEYEEGYSSFNISAAELKGRHELFKSFILGVTGKYSHRYVWSKNSPKEKLLWEWEINSATGGAGFSWKPLEKVSFAAEYEYSDVKIDSSKFIDSRFFSANSGDHSLRAGIEYQIIRDIFIRGGYNLDIYEKDIVFGGDDISINRITGGLGVYIFPSLGIDIHIEYGFYRGLPAEIRRSDYSAFTTVKLYSF